MSALRSETKRRRSPDGTVLSASGSPNVACVLTKIDLYPQWRQVEELDRAHLRSIDPDIPLFPVSSNLRLMIVTATAFRLPYGGTSMAISFLVLTVHGCDLPTISPAKRYLLKLYLATILAPERRCDRAPYSFRRRLPTNPNQP